MSLEERFFALGLANLRGSIALFGSMADSNTADWNDCCAAASLAEHGVELFLKGGIWHAEGNPGGTHELETLFRTFNRLYANKAFAFQSKLAELVQKKAGQPYAEFYRYPITRKRELLHHSVHFDSSIWARELEFIRGELETMQQSLIDKYPYVQLEGRLVKRALGVSTFEVGNKTLTIPSVEVVPEPRTNAIYVGDKGRVTITSWRAKENGL